VKVSRGADAGRSFTATGETVTVGTAKDNDLVLGDPTVSRYHLELRRNGDRIRVADLGSTNGTRVGPALLERGAVSVVPGTAIQVGQTALEVDDADLLLLEMHAAGGIGDLRGRSAVMRRLFASLEKVARSEVPLLVVGEPGTGKDLLARVVHEVSPRAKGPLVAVECGSPEAELRSAIARAARGTLVLRDVGDLPLHLQVALQRPLEAAHARIVSTSTRDLRADVNAATFRADLYYRLAVVSVAIPPLRERTEDIPILIEHFLRVEGWEGEAESLFPPQALEALVKHRWPGNVRELENVVDAALTTGVAAHPQAAPPGAPLDPIPMPASSRYRDARAELLLEFERRWLTALLERSSGNVRAAAREAQMDRSHLIDLLHRHGLKGTRG
jgi:DNA-binding NtrC family response regulator